MWSNFLSFFLSFYPLTVQWEKPVVFSSKLSYFVGQPKKRWSDVDFNEDWKTASEGTWGSYDSSSTAAFRAGFKVSNDQGYTYALLLLRGEGTASIFVNGASFGKATLEPAACRVVIPFSFLTSGDNVIAVSLAKGASSTISFALSVELNTTPQLRLTEGVASAIQAKPSPSHPAGDAFLDDDVFSHYWLATTFPSELVFTFNNTQQVVNRVHMMNSVTRQPFSMQVVGVNGDERVLLASFNRDSIAQGASGTEAVFLTFNNLCAFSSIHLVFDSTAEDCAVQMTGIRFYGRSLYTCPKKWGYSGVYADQTMYTRCPLGYTGRRGRQRSLGGEPGAVLRGEPEQGGGVRGLVVHDQGHDEGDVGEEHEDGVGDAADGKHVLAHGRHCVPVSRFRCGGREHRVEGTLSLHDSQADGQGDSHGSGGDRA